MFNFFRLLPLSFGTTGGSGYNNACIGTVLEALPLFGSCGDACHVAMLGLARFCN